MKNTVLPKSKEELDTINSFNYQWSHLSDSKNLLTDESWRERMSINISIYELSITKEEIKNKTVIDVGWGSGRSSYGFAKLSCKVTSVDISEGPCKLAKINVPQAEVINVGPIQITRGISPNRKFDIVWCWGVIHHTANSRIGI